MSNKLIIIGNGFDLHCDLNSKFSSFFEKSEIPKVEKWLKEKNISNFKDLSFITLLLYNSYYREDFAYCDIYNEYHKICYKDSYSKLLHLEENLVDWMNVEGFLDLLLKSSATKTIINCFDRVSKTKSDRINNCICELDDIAIFINQCLIPRKYFSIDSFYDFLFAELKIFENSFVTYLTDELKNNREKYSSNSNKIFSSIVGDGNSGIILNFNYTHIKNCRGFKEINIHGSLEDEIIIGIDDQGELDESVVQFTKTFRKLIDVNKSVVLNDSFDEVIIYGHSLGKQDHSYFQSIFDFVNIYRSGTRIKYIYSDDFIKDDGFNIGYTKSIHRIEMAKKLFNLMRLYGRTLDNKDNGHNLIHKMILEGRLKIELDNFND